VIPMVDYAARIVSQMLGAGFEGMGGSN
jgi:hypothetical protein